MSWKASAYAKSTRGHPNTTTKCVLMILADYHDDEKGYAFPSQARLANDCENTVRSVRSALVLLEKMGFISRIQKGHQGKESRYAFNFSCVQAYQTENPGQPVAEDISGSQENPKRDKRKTNAPVAESPANTSHNKPPQVTSPIKTFMSMLKDERGYESTNYGAESKSVKAMDALGYSGADMLECYQKMKNDPWWQEKPLTMMSVKSAIGEWKKHSDGPSKADRDRQKYAKDAERFANRPVARSEG